MCGRGAFADEKLEASVRKATQIGDEVITADHVAGLASLRVRGGIVSLDGIECLSNLSQLYF